MERIRSEYYKIAETETHWFTNPEIDEELKKQVLLKKVAEIEKKQQEK
jgi:hypothetical protein